MEPPPIAMSLWNTLRNHAGKLLAIGALGAGLTYGHQEANDPGEEIYRGETEEGQIVYREDVGHLEEPVDGFGLEKNVMEVEQDGKTYIIEVQEFEKDLNLENREYTVSIPDKVTVKTEDGEEVYWRDGNGSGAVISKAKQVYNDARKEIKKELILQREFGDDMITDRDTLIEQIDQQLASTDHTHRKYTPYTEDFTDEKASNLSLEELNQVHTILEGIQDEQTLEQLGYLINADFTEGDVTLDGLTDWGREGLFTIRADSTEIGGLVRKTEDGIDFVPAEPASTHNNASYHLPLVQANIPAVTAFHLHAVNENGDAEYAGPSGNLIQSGGDLVVAAATQRSGTVVTYLGTDEENNIRVNLDFYTVDLISPQPEITVIDLGDYDTGVALE